MEADALEVSDVEVLEATVGLEPSEDALDRGALGKASVAAGGVDADAMASR